MLNGKPAKWLQKKINEKGATVILQNVKLAFVHVATPKAFEGQDPNYMVSALVPSKEFNSMKAQVEKTVKEILRLDGSLNEKQKAQALKTALSFGDPGSIFKDGNEAVNKEGVVYDGMEDHWVLKAKTRAEQLADDSYRPKVDLKIVDSRNNTIPKEELEFHIYSGVWADVAIVVKAYSPKGSVPAGITCYLSGIMKLKDGDRLGQSSPFESRDDMVGFDESEEEAWEPETPEPKKPAKKSGKGKF